MKSRNLLFPFVFLITLSFQLSAQDSNVELAKRKEIANQLLIATHADKLADQVLNQVIQAMTPVFAQSLKARKIPESQASEFLKKFPPNVIKIFNNGDMKRKLFVPTVDFYAEQFSLNELQELLAFHQSGLGQKVIAKTPDLLSRSMQGGQAVGQAIGLEAYEMTAKEVGITK
jgi:uncharacterized protein